MKIFFLLFLMLVSISSAQMKRDYNNPFRTSFSFLDKKNYSISSSDFFDKNNYYSVTNIGGQAIVGAATSVALSIPIYFLLIEHNDIKEPSAFGNFALVLLFFSTYTFGTALGVDWIASIENPNNKLLNTFLASVIGGAVGLTLSGLYSQSYLNENERETLQISLALSPLISSLIYSLFIAEWSE